MPRVKRHPTAGRERRVLVAVQEVGAANALTPVIRELQRRPHVEVHLVAAGKSQDVLRAAGVPFEPVDRPAALDDAYQERVSGELAARPADVVLVGTSTGPGVDKVLTNAASSLGIPSLAVIDHWSNYRDRFAWPSTAQLRYLPTKVAVMDDTARREAIAAGLPADALVVTGQPYLEAVLEHVHDRAVERSARDLRAKWTGTARRSDPLFVLFASEVVEESGEGSTPRKPSYSERDVLDGLFEAVSRLPPALRARARVVVKLHPEESMRSSRLSDRFARVHDVLDGAPAWPCLLASDCVVGIDSMLLLEAGMAGCPTIAFQPGAEVDAFVGARLGVVTPASRPDELVAALGEALRGGRRAADSTPRYRPPSGSAQRIADAVLELAGSQGSTP